MPAWPAGLPQKVAAEQYEEILPFDGVEHEMDAGAPYLFGAGEGIGTNFSVVLDLDVDQVEILDNFWRTDLLDGESTFTWVHPRTQAAETFLFLEQPVYTHIAGEAWRARLAIETRTPFLHFGSRSVSGTRTTAKMAIGATFASVSVTGTLTDAEME